MSDYRAPLLIQSSGLSNELIVREEQDILK
jgi:hypothetical protein